MPNSVERLNIAMQALQRIALNVSGDLPAQNIAGDALRAIQDQSMQSSETAPTVPMFDKGDLRQFLEWYHGIKETPGLHLNDYDHVLNAKVQALFDVAHAASATPSVQTEPELSGEEVIDLVSEHVGRSVGTWGEINADELVAAFRKALAASPAGQSAPTMQELTVWYGPMPESNGKSNFTAVLMRKGGSLFDGLTGGFTIARSEYPDRVRYDADCVRYLIGELEKEPFILDYDADKHSGYTAPREEE